MFHSAGPFVALDKVASGSALIPNKLKLVTRPRGRKLHRADPVHRYQLKKTCLRVIDAYDRKVVEMDPSELQWSQMCPDCLARPVLDFKAARPWHSPEYREFMRAFMVDPSEMYVSQMTTLAAWLISDAMDAMQKFPMGSTQRVQALEELRFASAVAAMAGVSANVRQALVEAVALLTEAKGAIPEAQPVHLFVGAVVTVADSYTPQRVSSQKFWPWEFLPRIAHRSVLDAVSHLAADTQGIDFIDAYDACTEFMGGRFTSVPYNCLERWEKMFPPAPGELHEQVDQVVRAGLKADIRRYLELLHETALELSEEGPVLCQLSRPREMREIPLGLMSHVTINPGSEFYRIQSVYPNETLASSEVILALLPRATALTYEVLTPGQFRIWDDPDVCTPSGMSLVAGLVRDGNRITSDEAVEAALRILS